MEKPFNTRLGWTRRLARNSDPDPTQVRPYGPYGGGLITAHPIGLLVVAAMGSIILWRLPEARWFFGGALALGALVGLVLRLRNR